MANIKTTTFSVIIVDDEPAARESLKACLQLLYPDVIIAAEAGDITEAIARLSNVKADIVFMDIALSEQRSFEILDQLSHLRIQPVFVTGYEEYALKAFSYAALAYLLKPVSINELQQVVDRVLMSKREYPLLAGDAEGRSSPAEYSDKKMFIPERNGWRVVKLKQICFIEADGSYCKISIDRGQAILSSKNLKYYEQKLAASGRFIRVHKSYLVNTDFIESYHSTTKMLTLSTGDQLPVTISARLMRELTGGHEEEY